MIVARDPETLRRVLARVSRRRLAGRGVGFVPTMGSLHPGHEALIRRCRARCKTTVVSIYVNPLQFESSRDFRRYPRTLARDLNVLRRLGVDIAYCPADGAFFSAAKIRVAERRVSSMLEGAVRPGHFEGVLTIVAKLFLHVKPDDAFFGEKDFQQLWLIRKMAEELPFGVRIHAAKTVRDPRTGLALSSRNILLSPAARVRASCLYRELIAARSRLTTERRAGVIAREVRRRLARQVDRVNYASIVDAENFQEIQGRLVPGKEYRLLASVRLAGVHLIDNLPIRIS